MEGIDEKQRDKLRKEVKWLRWTKGRQIGEYLILPLVRHAKIPFDCYIIKYPVGSSIPRHTDPIKKGLAHHRLNFVFKKCKAGGEYQGEYVWKWGRVNVSSPRPA